MEIEYTGNELDLFKNAINWKKYFSSRISKYIKGNVLEVGAGLGINTPFMLNSFVNSWTYLEPDADLSQQITKNNQLLNTKQEIITGTIDNVLLDDKKYDTIIYIDVLEHIEDSKSEILKIKKVLSKDGHLIILVPAFNFLYNEFDKKIGHFRRYDKNILKNEINNLLINKEIFYLDSLGLLASLVNKFFLHKPLPSENNILFWDKIIIPLSKFTDVITFNLFGKSLIGIYKNNNSTDY